MKVATGCIFTWIFVAGQLCSSAQKLHYTAQETAAIHDSINRSRWDIGRRLSQYSFRLMSGFFPVGIIHKSNQPYPFRSNDYTSFDNIIFKSGQDALPFEDYLETLHIASFIVVRKGSIVYEKYFSMPLETSIRFSR